MNMIWIVHWSRSLSCSWWSLEWRSHSRRCCQSSEDHLQLCPSSWDESASWSGSTWSQRRRQRGERRGRWSNSAWQTPVWQLGPGAVAPSQQSLLSSSILFHWIKLFKLVTYSNYLGLPFGCLKSNISAFNGLWTFNRRLNFCISRPSEGATNSVCCVDHSLGSRCEWFLISHPDLNIKTEVTDSLHNLDTRDRGWGVEVYGQPGVLVTIAGAWQEGAEVGDLVHCKGGWGGCWTGPGCADHIISLCGSYFNIEIAGQGAGLQIKILFSYLWTRWLGHLGAWVPADGLAVIP